MRTLDYVSQVLVCSSMLACGGGGATTGSTASTASSASSGGTGESSGAGATGSTGSGATSSTGSGATGGSSSAMCAVDGMIVENPGCSIWDEEPCGPDEKCMPFDPDPTCLGFCLSDFRCVPLVDEPGQAGDPCEVLPEDRDSCGRGLFCADTICQARCGCENGEPTCPNPPSYCQESGTYNLCVTFCDPRVQDCPEWLPICEIGYSRFACGRNLGMLVKDLHGDCTYPKQCVPGLFCGRQVPQCGGVDCCVAPCDVDEPACPLPGQTCELYPPRGFGGGPPPNGLADLGLCIGP